MILILLLLVSMLKSTGFGIHHKGYALVALLAGLALAARAMNRRGPAGLAIGVAAITLIFPFVQCVRMIARDHAVFYGGDTSVQWVLQHVDPGTRVCTQPTLRALLPTPEASAAIWGEVMDDSAWKRKFSSGLKRFAMDTSELPRAMSEENLVQERAARRRWFILGSRLKYPETRYDLRTFQSSILFGLIDLEGSYKQDGGVWIWNDHLAGRQPPAFFGHSVIEWTGADGWGEHIFVAPQTLARVHLEPPAKIGSSSP